MKTSALTMWCAAASMTLVSACGTELVEPRGEHDATTAAQRVVSGPISESSDTKSFIFNGHVYVIRNQAIAVVNVSSPGQLVSRFDFGAGCMPWRMAAKGNYLFVATECGAPVLDISDPANLRQVATLATTPGGVPRYVKVAGNRLYLSEYLAGWNFAAHDITDPAAPVKLGQRRLPTNGSNMAAISAVLTPSLVAVHSPGAGVLIVDVSNPAAMPTVGVVPSPTTGLAVKGSVLYLLRGGDFYGSWAGSVETWNVANPAAPVRLGQRDLGRIVSDWDSFSLSVQGGRTYVLCGGDDGAYEQDFVAVDVTDPSNPSQPVLLPLWLAAPEFAITAADIDVFGSVAYVYGWKVPMEPWIGYEYFLAKIDISNPMAPVLLSKTALPPFAVQQPSTPQQ